jgi:epoxyqueuosine reductase
VPEELAEQLKQQALKQGFALAGVAAVPGGERLQMRTAALQRWLAAGHQADMAWMADERRLKVEKLLPGVRSLLAVGLNYYVDGQQAPGMPRIARYGWGRDYHRVIEQRLRRLGRWLEQQVPNCRWRVCVDTAPLLDKAWAEQAGIGWIGKNGNLISRSHGSWLLLGHLLSTVPLQADAAQPSLCGGCTSCIPACPTDALVEPFVLDSRRCIAFHTIENRSAHLPLPLHGWVAGCDLCQEACPWNQQRAQANGDPELQPGQWILDTSPTTMANWDDSSWARALQASALRRIKPWMWRRNLWANGYGTGPGASAGST